MWKMETISGYNCYTKHYDESSVFGINGGRISKLEIRRNNKIVANYDRGWDVEPSDTEVQRVISILIEKYN